MQKAATWTCMSETNATNQQHDMGSVFFECERCGSTQSRLSVSYNWLGYPVCPACNYDHTP